MRGLGLKPLDVPPNHYPPARQEGVRGFVQTDTRNIPAVSQPLRVVGITRFAFLSMG